MFTTGVIDYHTPAASLTQSLPLDKPLKPNEHVDSRPGDGYDGSSAMRLMMINAENLKWYTCGSCAMARSRTRGGPSGVMTPKTERLMVSPAPNSDVIAVSLTASFHSAVHGSGPGTALYTCQRVLLHSLHQVMRARSMLYQTRCIFSQLEHTSWVGGTAGTFHLMRADRRELTARPYEAAGLQIGSRLAGCV
jgi:hypothetical protein